jgi:hypothetical protein
MEELKVTVESGVKELEIRTGDAGRIIESKAVNIVGIINTPLEYLKVRKQHIDFAIANIQVHREGLSIIISLDENLDIESKISGILSLTQEFKNFGINSGKGWVPRELAEFIKMNRVCFESKDTANKLCAILSDVKIRIDKVVEDQKGQQGKIRQLKEQTLKECNIPENLTLEMPIFKGAKKSTFLVEIWINPDDLSVKLISPDAADIIRQVRDEEIDSVITQIREICPELAILEI